MSQDSKLRLFITAIGLMAMAAILASMGCAGNPLISTPSQQLNPETVYRRDMIVTVNGVTDDGVLVVPMRETNSFKVTARGDLDLFAMTTCHREWTKENAGNVTETVQSGWFGWGSKEITDPRKVTFDYAPVKGIEDDGACPVMLSGFDKKGKNSWGFVDFQTKEFQLKMHIGCNGVAKDVVGVAACQSRAGLYQVVTFDQPVMYSPDPGCDLGKPISQGFNGFKFPIPKGMCTYRFESVDKSGNLLGAARLTLIGYESILIRDDAQEQ